MQERTRYLIVGAGATGMAAVQSISELDPLSSITLISDEGVGPYFRPLIPYIVNGTKTFGDIELRGRGPYKSSGTEIKLKSRIESVNVKNRTVSTGDSFFKYDKLLLATGSRPKIPGNMKGTNNKGVYTLRYYSDAVGMADRCSSSKRAVMAGGGLLNLKAAFALREKGLEVKLIVTSPAILSQLMEPEDSYLLREAITGAEIEIITGKSIREIVSGNNGVEAVLLDDGDELSCDLVCIGKGVEPVVEFLNGSEIILDKGIVANEYTETNIPDIYAAGDVAVTHNPITSERVVTGLWTNAAEMGRCAGRNMAGYKTMYTGTFGIMNATQIGNVPFVSMGFVHSKNTGLETHVSSSPGRYRKIVFSGDGSTLMGALFVGDIEKAGLYRYIIRERKDIVNIKDHIISHDLHYGHILKTATSAV